MSENINKDKLNTIAFHITDNCNAHCPMCYENAQQSMDLNGDLETLKKIAHNAIAFGKVENFLMVGGDPCEFPYLVELMRYIKDEGEKYGWILLLKFYLIPMTTEKMAK